MQDARGTVSLLTSGRSTQSDFRIAHIYRGLGDTCSRLTKLVIAFLYFSFDSVRCALFRLLGYSAGSRFVALMYHSVKTHEREQFARQMDLLVRLTNPVAGDFTGHKNGDNRSFVAVTFDDGYQSVLENPLPILQQKKIPVILFVPTNSLGSKPLGSPTRATAMPPRGSSRLTNLNSLNRLEG